MINSFLNCFLSRQNPDMFCCCLKTEADGTFFKFENVINHLLLVYKLGGSVLMVFHDVSDS